jgi:polyisoprenoid-binding protein YceI
MRNLYLAGTAAMLIGAAAAAAAAASYTADTEQSRLEFVGVQAGAEFKGVFHKFTANVDFAPDALAGSRIDVQIDMNSVD